jgi:predicted DNA binding CopG/RHH family protein
MKKKYKKIPNFKSIPEEAEFWDTHSFTDYLPLLKDVKVVYKPTQPKEDVIIVRVQTGLKKRLEKKAEQEGLPLSTMLRTWFIKMLR